MVSCKKSATTSPTGFTPDCSGAAKSYKTNVAPIISSNCVGCHSQYSYYSVVSDSKSSIRSCIVGGTMPKNGSLGTADKNTIVCWIDSGALNN